MSRIALARGKGTKTVGLIVFLLGLSLVAIGSISTKLAITCTDDPPYTKCNTGLTTTTAPGATVVTGTAGTTTYIFITTTETVTRPSWTTTTSVVTKMVTTSIVTSNTVFITITSSVVNGVTSTATITSTVTSGQTVTRTATVTQDKFGMPDVTAFVGLGLMGLGFIISRRGTT